VPIGVNLVCACLGFAQVASEVLDQSIANWHTVQAAVAGAGAACQSPEGAASLRLDRGTERLSLTVRRVERVLKGFSL
jgi:hypothetical protein